MNTQPPSSTKPPAAAAAMTAGFPPPLSLSRYPSAPGSFFTSLADSGAGGMRQFFSGEPPPSMSSESPAAAAAKSGGGAAVRPYGMGEISLGDFAGGGGGSPKSGGGDDVGILLSRHSSSPAGFFSNLLVDSVTRDTGSCSRAGGDGVHAMASRKLKSQLSFTRQGTLSQISEDGIPDLGESLGGGGHSDETSGNVTRSFSGGISIGSWDDTNSIVFSAPASKRSKDGNGDIITALSSYESQFNLPRTSLEMATVEKYLQIQHDQVPFKVRAKRGCATHPRSIAERERRTRISEKLRKLQELVPNMDKQTSTADMLDLAARHIKGLQSQLEILKEEKEKCTCCSKQE